METIEKLFPPEGAAFFAPLLSYYQEQLARLHLEGDAQVQQFNTALTEKDKELNTEFATHGISFHVEVAPLFVHTYYQFMAIKHTKEALALLKKEYARRLKRYRAAVSRIVEDAAPFPLAVRSEIKGIWELIEHTDPTRLNEEAAFRLWGEQYAQVSDVSKKKSRKHALWGTLEKTLFSMFTGKGNSEGQTYTLIELLWSTCLPNEFDGKWMRDSIRLRVKKERSPEKGPFPKKHTNSPP